MVASQRVRFAYKCNARFFIERNVCPVCGDDQYEVLYSCAMTAEPVRSYIASHYRKQGTINWNNLDGTDFILCDCQQCGSLWQKHAPNEFVLDKIYNEMIAAESLRKLEQRRLTVGNYDKIAGELAVLFRMVGKHPTDVHMLDYGYGYGRWGRVAAAMGAKVCGVEISPEKIETAKSIGIESISEDALSKMQFDIVHTEQVFEHLTEPAREFGKLAKTLLPGGIMKISVPPQGNIRRLLAKRGMIGQSPQEVLWDCGKPLDAKMQDSDYVAISPLEHLNVFSPTAIELLAKQNELIIVSRVRRQAVPIYVTSVSQFVASVAQLLKVSLRSVLRVNSGYYIVRRPMSAGAPE